MAEYLAVVEVDLSVIPKLNGKHICTPDEVREALQWPARAETVWEDDPEHGLRVVAIGTTGTGRELIAWLQPVPDWDPHSGHWKVRSARWV